MRPSCRPRKLKEAMSEFETSLVEGVFITTEPDSCVYTYASGDTLVSFILYMDDILFTGRKAALVHNNKLGLMACYIMAYLIKTGHFST